MQSITVEELKKLLDEKADEVCIIDVRLPWQFGMGHIPRAINVPWVAGSANPAEYPNKTLYIYCPEGVRSARMVAELNQKGFSNVVNIRGGFHAWQAAEFDIEK